MHASYINHTLHFNFPAGTSRGVLRTKDTHFIVLEENGKYGIGECSYIKGLSSDKVEEIVPKLNELCNAVNSGHGSASVNLDSVPSILFGLETALLDLNNGGNRIIFPSDFSKNSDPIEINGLVWMGEEEFMRKQVREKLNAGFSCIKLKIGALDFETEYEIVKSIRKEFGESDITIRVDANGAYDYQTARRYLERLSKFKIHSIEQPLPVGLIDDMQRLCSETPIPIALDEQLIGVTHYSDKEEMLDYIKPQYIILKPGIIGGFKSSDEWIDLANKKNIGWWITSALESNIGLNAICQYSYVKNKDIIHGLGTGMLFSNNIPSPLTVQNGKIQYIGHDWDLELIFNS